MVMMEHALSIIKKRRNRHIRTIISRLIEDKPENHIWSNTNLLTQTNNKLTSQYKIQNVNVLGNLLSYLLRKQYQIFKNVNYGSSQFIFVKRK